jgi:hypothetical protein
MVTNNFKQGINENILFEKIEETDKNIKYIINLVMFLGSVGFTVTGISSYLNKDILSFLEIKNIIFFPQGLTMLIYGTLGLIFSINQLRILILEVGEGYNEFNKNTGTMTLFRKGTNNAKKSDIKIIYPLNDIESIKIEVKSDLFNTKQRIYICNKNNVELPIFQPDRPLKIKELEQKAIKLASFLQVPIKGI